MNAQSDDNIERLLKLAGPRPEPSAAVRDEVYAAVRQAWESGHRRSRNRRTLAFAVAATVVVAVFIAWWLPARSPAPVFDGPLAQLDRGELEISADAGWRPVATGDTLDGGAVLRTVADPAGLAMLNGVSLRLGRSSQIELLTPRRVRLHGGRLYADTAGKRFHAGSAIEIETPDGLVRDVGTRFEVRVEPGRTAVRVRDGVVMLATGSGEAAAGRGQALLFDNGQLERDVVSPTSPDWSWTLVVAPHFDTDGRRVSELVDWVARETGRELRYADALVRNSAVSTRIHGSVNAASPEETLELALQTTRFSFDLQEMALTIDKRREE